MFFKLLLSEREDQVALRTKGARALHFLTPTEMASELLHTLHSSLPYFVPERGQTNLQANVQEIKSPYLKMYPVAGRSVHLTLKRHQLARCKTPRKESQNLCLPSDKTVQ